MWHLLPNDRSSVETTTVMTRGLLLFAYQHPVNSVSHDSMQGEKEVYPSLVLVDTLSVQR
jgi:hypothetical protein